jgi:autotransporter-associated beta strand protein
LTVVGAGTLSLNNATNTFGSGLTGNNVGLIVQGGTLQNGVNNAVHTNVMANIESGTWDLNGYDQVVRSVFSKGGIILGGAAGTAAVTTGAGLLTIKGDPTSQQSRIDYLSTNNPQGAVINGRVEYNNTNNLMFFLVQDSTNAPIDLTINATISKAGAANTGTFFMGGGGSLLLNGANTFAASQIRIDSGSMILGTADPANGSAGALGTNATGVWVGFNDAGSGSGALLLRDGVTSARTVRTINNTNVARAADTRTLGGYDSTGTATFSGAIQLWNSANDGATARLQALGTSTILFTGNISDDTNNSPVGITKIGSGTVVLSGANTFRGGMRFNGGTLVLANPVALAAGNYLRYESQAANGADLVKVAYAGAGPNLGNLDVDVSGAMDLGTNSSAQIRFATATNWTVGTTLTITNSTGGGKLYILDATSLNLTQIVSAENPTYPAAIAANGLVTFTAPTPVGSTFTSWLGSTPATSDLLLQYAFGAVSATQPVAPAYFPQASVTETGGVRSLVLTYYVRQGTQGLEVEPELSTDLSAANNGFAESVSITKSDHEISEVGGVSVKRWTASVPIESGAAKKFLRARVTQN